MPENLEHNTPVEEPKHSVSKLLGGIEVPTMVEKMGGKEFGLDADLTGHRTISMCSFISSCLSG